MPDIPDADPGIPKGGVLPSTSKERGSAPALRWPWRNRGNGGRAALGNLVGYKPMQASALYKSSLVCGPLSALLRQAMVRTRTWTALGSPADPRGLRIPRWE